ncbi:MAG: hypothetical protein HOF69_02415 [Campylobacteraceae bacterium]|nr:hypothetical protein [Campylobacteraceae bacterium]
MHNFKAILKISILTIAFLGMIIYMTAKPPVKVDTTTSTINMKYMPKMVKLLDDDIEYATSSIIKNGSVIVVTNHDSIAVVNTLDKYIENVVIVTNISAAPWFVKQWIIPEKLIALKADSKTAWGYDESGIVKNFFKIKSDNAATYEVFLMKDNQIAKLFDGKVKDGALDGSMSVEEIEKLNLEIASKIKQIKG